MPQEPRPRRLDPRLRSRRDLTRVGPRGILAWALGAALLAIVASPLAPQTAQGRVADLPAPEACINCHIEMSVMSHPVGILPSLAGRGLPLAPDGTITCGTCHGVGPHRATPAELPNPADTCKICHERGGHGESPMLAHLVRMDPESGSFGLLEVTKDCASCHDGSSARRAHVRHQTEPRPRGEVAPVAELRRGHPVGVDYLASRSVRPRGYRPTSDLPPQIMFEAGVVGCASCHDLYSDHRSRLVVDNRGSVLCLSCHAKTPTPPLVPVEPRLAMLSLRR